MSLIAATIAGVLAYKAGKGVPRPMAEGTTNYLLGSDALSSDPVLPTKPITLVVQKPLTMKESWFVGLTSGLTVAIVTHYWRQAK